MLHGERDLQRKPQLMISGNYPARGAPSACARARAWRADAQRQGGKRAGWQEGGAVGGARLASSRSAEVLTENCPPLYRRGRRRLKPGGLKRAVSRGRVRPATAGPCP